MTARILRSGLFASVQDSGRFGYRTIGVGPGGALDVFAARIANLVVGNDESSAVIEIAFGSFRVRFNDSRLISWCGGDFEVHLGEIQIPAGHLCFVSDTDEITIRNPKVGCRAWLAISGGIDVSRVLGSRSTDLRAGFGGFTGRALRDGDDLPLGRITPESFPRFERLRKTRCSDWSPPTAWTKTALHYSSLRVLRGAAWSQFDLKTHDALLNEAFSVTAEADRMGIRFDGPKLERHEGQELLSEAVAPGTIQVPPNGNPILLLGDCQTIGGYPKIANVITVDLPVAAQLRAGDHVQFREVSLKDAHQLLLERERELERFRIGLSLRA